MRIIGLDIGTTSITGLVYDLEQRSVLHCITEENTASISGSLKDWERLQNPEAIVNTVQQILNNLRSSEPEADAIGLTGQMHGIVYTDQSGEHVSPLYTWQDGRAAQPYNDCLTYAQMLSEATGYTLAPGYGLATHFYNMHQGLVPAQAVHVCTIADYAVMRLTGSSVPLMDSTQAAGLGCFSIPSGAFEEAALARAGMDTGLLPRIVPSGTLAGRTSDGTKVYTSLGDNQASFLGSVPFPGQTLLVNIGTGSQLSGLLTELSGGVEGLEARPFPGGDVLMVGAALSGGKSYALLEQFIRRLIEAYTGQAQQELYPLMDTLLKENLDPANGLTVNPQFLGTRINPEERGSVEGITLDNFTPGVLSHAFLQGMADELYGFYTNFEHVSSGSRWTGLIGSGNALRANPALRKKVEERFGLPLTLSTASEEAAVGAALCAAVGAGVIGSFKEAGQYLG